MSKKWHSGPPPSVGWWPASMVRDEDVFRWWNGLHWSAPAQSSHTAEYAAAQARVKSHWEPGIEWQHRPASWPARSRT
jgi:hypothetical protein